MISNSKKLHETVSKTADKQIKQTQKKPVSKSLDKLNKSMNKLNKSVNKLLYKIFDKPIDKPILKYSNNSVNKFVKKTLNKSVNLLPKKTINNINNCEIIKKKRIKKSSHELSNSNLKRIQTQIGFRSDSGNMSPGPVYNSEKKVNNLLKFPQNENKQNVKDRSRTKKKTTKIMQKQNFMNKSYMPNFKNGYLDISTVFIPKNKNANSAQKLEICEDKIINLKKVNSEIVQKIQIMSSLVPICGLDKDKFIEELWRKSSIPNNTKRTNSRFSVSNRSINLKSNKSNKSSFLLANDIDKNRFFEKKKQVYDSFGDNESEEDPEMEGKIIYPDSYFIFVLDGILLIATLNYCFHIPLKLAKNICFCSNINEYSNIIFYFTDILFILDMCVSFFRAYYNKELKLVKTNYKIILHYITGDFFFDMLAAFPVYSLIYFICSGLTKIIVETCHQYSMPTKFFIYDILLNMKIFKLSKVIDRSKNTALNYFLELSSENFNLEKTTLILRGFICVFSVIHFFVCFNIFLGKQTYPNWLLYTKINDHSLICNYIASFYALMQTLTTVGYGDSVCQSITERIFQIIIISIGVVSYSYLVSYAGNYIKNESHVSIKYHDDLNILKDIRANYPQMSCKLYNKINEHLESRTKVQKNFDVNLLINSLPFTLKNHIMFVMYNSAINNFSFFKNCNNSDFIIKTLTSFRPLVAKKFEFLIFEGEMIDDIVFVKDGRLSLEAAIDIDRPEESIENYFKKNFEEIDNRKKKKKLSNTQIQNISINQVVKIKKSLKLLKRQLTDAIKTGKSFFIDKQYNKTKSRYSSCIEREVRKYLTNDPIKNDEGNYKYLKIIDIRKNENFGGLFMFLRRPAPLSLQVRSKIAELFLLQKSDVFDISKSYPNIWKKIHKKDFHNMVSIKKITFNILKKFIRANGVVIENTTLINEVINESSKISKKKHSLNSSNNNNHKNNHNYTRISKISKVSKGNSYEFDKSISKFNIPLNFTKSFENLNTEQPTLYQIENSINDYTQNNNINNIQNTNNTNITNNHLSLDNSTPTNAALKKLSKSKNISFITESINVSSKRTETVIIPNNGQQPNLLFNIMSEETMQKKEKNAKK